jgi:hypothetical protein
VSALNNVVLPQFGLPVKTTYKGVAAALFRRDPEGRLFAGVVMGCSRRGVASDGELVAGLGVTGSPGALVDAELM